MIRHLLPLHAVTGHLCRQIVWTSLALFSILYTTIYVLFHVNNQVQHYKRLSAEKTCVLIFIFKRCRSLSPSSVDVWIRYTHSNSSNFTDNLLQQRKNKYSTYSSITSLDWDTSYLLPVPSNYYCNSNVDRIKIMFHTSLKSNITLMTGYFFRGHYTALCVKSADCPFKCIKQGWMWSVERHH